MVESDKSTDSNLHNPIRLTKSRQILNNQEKNTNLKTISGPAMIIMEGD
ncbi:hypothetical protein OIU79_008071 [Salix purpurea]|uniref:Uncharacterized protein n=1 Tax=Salix purpurea TaxID=77065 RepID=A0A9Q0THI1_SALPP|nr:hypothetical protein OIU79_008071 [Salix purpurea]